MRFKTGVFLTKTVNPSETGVFRLNKTQKGYRKPLRTVTTQRERIILAINIEPESVQFNRKDRIILLKVVHPCINGK